jgi:hypothetical protein
LFVQKVDQFDPTPRQRLGAPVAMLPSIKLSALKTIQAVPKVLSQLVQPIFLVRHGYRVTQPWQGGFLT